MSGRAPATWSTSTSSNTRGSGGPVTPSPAIAARRSSPRVRPLGHDHFHAMVDDHSRLAYGELRGDEKAATVTAFLIARSRTSPPTASRSGGS